MNAGGLWESQGKRPPREAVTGHLIRREGPYTPEIGNTLLRSSISLSGFSFSQPIYKGRSRSPVTHLGAACVNTEPTPATQTMCARAPTPGLRDPPPGAWSRLPRGGCVRRAVAVPRAEDGGRGALRVQAGGQRHTVGSASSGWRPGDSRPCGREPLGTDAPRAL